MSVVFIWTKTKQVGSRLIRWGLNEPVSHFAIIRQFDDPDQGVVIHQEFHGFDISWYPTWLKNNDIVYALTPKVPFTGAEWGAIRTPIMNRFSGTEYDFTGIYYFAYRALLQRWFAVPLSDKNLWGDAKEPLCTGIATILHQQHPEWFSHTPNDFDMVSPYQLYQIMNRNDFLVPWTGDTDM